MEKERLWVAVLNNAALPHAWPFFLGRECALILCHDWPQSGCLAPTVPQNRGRAGPSGKLGGAHGQPGETRPPLPGGIRAQGTRRTEQTGTQQELECGAGQSYFCIHHSFIHAGTKRHHLCFELLKNRDLAIRLIYMRGQRGRVWPQENVGGLHYEMTPGGVAVLVNRLQHI